MAKSEREMLTRALNSRSQILTETFQLLDQTPCDALQKVEWNEVMKLGEEVSKHATVAGMLWSGDVLNAKELKENMVSYCNMIHGLLLLCHGSSTGAGATLHSSIRGAAKQIMDCSLSFLRESISLYELSASDRKRLIPHLTGAVWEACASLKKTPTTSCTAIGRAIALVGVSIKDVLREMKEIKSKHATTTNLSDENDDNEKSSGEEEDLDENLSLEEMKVVHSVNIVVSDTLMVIRELIRFVSGLIKQSNDHFVESLERILGICRDIGVEIDELGACVYPPQEVIQMKMAAEKISTGLERIQFEAKGIEGSLESFFQVSEKLKLSLQKLQNELGSNDDDSMISKFEGIRVTMT